MMFLVHLSLSIIALSMVGCSYWSAASPTPLISAQIALNGAVLLEDYLEDPECDASEASVMEVASDVLNTPATLLSVSVAYSVALGWTIADFGEQTYEIVWKGMLEPETKLDPEKRFAQVRQWVPLGYAQPEHHLDGSKPPPCQQITVARHD